ncbi:MAG: glycogen debranching enzyme N-terminal domain-containing protein, partial [Candidatus Rokuibacteriota bacterium]
MARFAPAPLEIDGLVVRKERPASGAWPRTLLTQEWLVTNGLGGYAAGTIGGMATRRYHGLLTAAFPSPLGRWMMLNHLAESIRHSSGTHMPFGGAAQVRGSVGEHSPDHLREFWLEAGLPVWRYGVDGVLVEKRVYLPHMQNTVYVTYRLLAGSAPASLELRPAVHFRRNDAAVGDLGDQRYTMAWVGDRYELSRGPDVPPLRLRLDGPQNTFVLDGARFDEVLYPVEESRGYEASGDLWSPGCFRVDLTLERAVTLIASTENWETILALAPDDARWAERRRRNDLITAAHPAARVGLAAQLVLAADQFVIRPTGRVRDDARAQAAGDEVRSVIAGYHWFTDWGRDTMISLEGLTLTTGRHLEAGYILRTFHDYIRDGLIPNMFPEGTREGLYHTADATLWFFHALHRYLLATEDRGTLEQL